MTSPSKIMPRRKITSSRPFTTDYGTSKGHCGDADHAMIAAVKYLILNKQPHCTVEGPAGAVVRVRYNLHFGLAIEPVKTRKVKLRAVK